MLTDSDGRVHVESTKGHCIFTIEGAERQDEGSYSVIVRNPAGEDTAEIHVKVVGKMGPCLVVVPVGNSILLIKARVRC